MPRTPSGIAYDDTGAGSTALLFMPGWCGPRTLFEPLTSRLGDRFRCLALDWRGHGDSAAADGDFGSAELVDDALAVIADSGAERVVPVAASHAGWVALALRRHLGPTRIPKLVLADWMVLGTPPGFLDALAAMAAPASTRAVVDQLTGMWMDGLDIPDLSGYVATMRTYPDEMWARAARAIAAAYRADPSPLAAATTLDPVPATLHMYAQPGDPDYLRGQQDFAAAHPWFEVQQLNAGSHFPVYEVPDDMVRRIADFVAR